MLRQWISYRKKNRERPQIGDQHNPWPLGEIQPDRWLLEHTGELINVLKMLALLVELGPQQTDLRARICAGPLIPANKISIQGIVPPRNFLAFCRNAAYMPLHIQPDLARALAPASQFGAA